MSELCFFCWLLCHLCPKVTTKRVFKNDSNQPIFELQETEIQQAFENLAMDDCSVPPPNAHDYYNFGWASFECSSHPLSCTTAPASQILVLHRQLGPG
jgi:hypothetical protein